MCVSDGRGVEMFQWIVREYSVKFDQMRITPKRFPCQEEAQGDNEDSESDSDDDDDDVRVTIGDIKTGAPQYT